MRKLFTFLCAALMSVGMYAATVVTITEADFPTIGKSFTKDGVTITTGDSFSPSHDLLYPTFTSSVGNFTKIEISADNISLTGEGWSGGNTWTGNASSVSTDGDSYVFVFYGSITITCTIEEPEPEPQPAEVTVVFAANSNTVERTVTLPHEFLCSYYNANGELDAIIQELYGISDGRCCDYIYPVASGNEAVFAGSYGDDNYITISAAFEGTATVSGRYWNWDAYDGDGDWMDYSLTISIKGDEPEPTPTTYTLQLVADPEKGSVAVTNLLGSDIIDNGNGNYTVPENAEVTILATPLEGYEFSGWKVGNIDDMVGCYYCGVALNTNDNPLTITMTADAAYLAEFAAATPTAVENVQTNPVQATKFFRNGMLLIEKNGKIYNVQGVEVK